MKISREVPVNAYRAGEGFLPAYQKLVREVVIPYQYQVLNDKMEGVEKSHALEKYLFFIFPYLLRKQIRLLCFQVQVIPKLVIMIPA